MLGRHIRLMKVRFFLSSYSLALLVEGTCFARRTLLMHVLLLVSLPADFLVWVASPEAAFLKGKLVWANWDVEEMMARVKQIEEGDSMTPGLQGWPYNNYTSKTNDANKTGGTNETNGVNGH